MLIVWGSFNFNLILIDSKKDLVRDHQQITCHAYNGFWLLSKPLPPFLMDN